MERKYIKFIEGDENDLRKACKLAEEHGYRLRSCEDALSLEGHGVIECKYCCAYVVSTKSEDELKEEGYTEIKRTEVFERKYIKFIEGDKEDLEEACKLAEKHGYKLWRSSNALKFKGSGVLSCMNDGDYFIHIGTEAKLKKGGYTEIKRTKAFTQYTDGTKVKVIGCSNRHNYKIGTIITIKNCYGSNERCGYLYRTNQGTDPICSIDIELIEKSEPPEGTKVKIIGNHTQHGIPMQTICHVIFDKELCLYRVTDLDYPWIINHLDIELVEECIEEHSRKTKNFKVGDKVRLIKDGYENYSPLKIGDTFIIEEISDNTYLKRKKGNLGRFYGINYTYCELVEELNQDYTQTFSYDAGTEDKNILKYNKNSMTDKITEYKVNSFFKNKTNLKNISELQTILEDIKENSNEVIKGIRKEYNKFISIEDKLEEYIENNDLAKLKVLISSISKVKEHLVELNKKTVASFISEKEVFNIEDLLK